MALPTDAQERKDLPIFSGVLAYFPDALAEVARVSKAGNDQHNPGQPLHWAKHKSQDQHNCVARHLIEAGSIDTDGVRHSGKLAWRALALLQIEIEAEQAGMSVEAYNAHLRHRAGIKEAMEKAITDVFLKQEPEPPVRWDRPQPEEPGDDKGNRVTANDVLQAQRALRGPGGV